MSIPAFAFLAVTVFLISVTVGSFAALFISDRIWIKLAHRIAGWSISQGMRTAQSLCVGIAVGCAGTLALLLTLHRLLDLPSYVIGLAVLASVQLNQSRARN